MRVLITGGTGHIGRVTAEHLVQNGWDVRIIDLPPTAEVAGAEYAQCNILNFDDVLKHMRGCDFVIHLAGIRSPFLAPGHDIFQANATGTFNVFEAAAATGIRRVVQASSINAMGAFYNLDDVKVQYFPIDEDHPRFTTDPYSFSKQLVEDIGAYYWRREGISSIAMRFPGVYPKGYPETPKYLEKRNRICHLMDTLLSRPEAERVEVIETVRKKVLDFRQHRPFEFGSEKSPTVMGELYEDPLFDAYIGDRFNFWAFIDERDAAQALEKGLTASYDGDHVLFVNDSHNSLKYDTKSLIRLFFPAVDHFKADIAGTVSLVSIEQARKLIGFEPAYSIQNTTQF